MPSSTYSQARLTAYRRHACSNTKINTINAELNNKFTKDNTNKGFKSLTELYSSIWSKDKWDLEIKRNNVSKTLSNKYQDCQRDKALITTFCLCIILYAHTKNANLIWIIIEYFIFIYNILKCCVKVFYHVQLFISSKTVLITIGKNRYYVWETYNLGN